MIYELLLKSLIAYFFDIQFFRIKAAGRLLYAGRPIMLFFVAPITGENKKSLSGTFFAAQETTLKVYFKGNRSQVQGSEFYENLCPLLSKIAGFGPRTITKKTTKVKRPRTFEL